MTAANIYKLPIDYKLEDIDIFNYVGVELPYQVKTVIQQLFCNQWFYIYLPAVTNMARYFGRLLPKIDLLTDIKDVPRVETFKQQFETALHDNKFRRYCWKMFRRLGIVKGGFRNSEKTYRIGEFAEMFLILYLFNTDGLKKKFNYLLNTVFQSDSVSATSSTGQSRKAGSRTIKIVEKLENVPERLLNK